MKIIERIFENFILAICFVLITLPEIIYCEYLEIRDKVLDTIREL